MLETSSQDEQNSNNNTNKKMLLKVYLEKISYFNREYKFIVIYYHTQQMLLLN